MTEMWFIAAILIFSDGSLGTIRTNDVWSWDKCQEAKAEFLNEHGHRLVSRAVCIMEIEV